MDFVKIRGRDIQDCFMQMKMKYGPEAHVYEQRIVTEGGVFGSKLLAKKYIEIEIGVPEQQTSKDRVERKLEDLKELLRQKTGDESRNKKKGLSDIKPILSRERDRDRDRDREKRTPLEEENLNIEPHNTEFTPIIKRESRELGISMKDELLDNEPSFPVRQSYNNDSVYLRRVKEKLIKEGMTSDYVEELIQKADKHLSYIDKAKSSAVNEKIAEIMEDRISVDSDLFSGTGRGKRKVIFLVGPTGSGKTTTIAKLAAKYFLHMGRMVSLYTTDNYRIAAIEQLKRYADTMDIPFFAVKDLKKFKENLSRDGSELILIDTAGYNHKNPDFLEKMQAYQEAFSDRDQVENILVIPSIISASNMKSVMTAYEEVGYKRMILSKMDEADYISSALELADTYSKSFAYFSIGQEVPFDMIPASKKIFADLIMNPEKMKDIKGEAFAFANT
jgi:flagellar biosynthesis protein FlhF